MTNTGFKILILADGQSFHTERFLDETRKQGCDIRLASLENSPLVDYLLKRNTPISKLHYVLAVSQLKKIIADFKPDIINAHFASGYGHLAAQTNFEIPIALNLWGSDILIVPMKSVLHKQKTIKALKAASLVFADSNYLLNQARQLYNFKKGTTIPWGIEKSLIPSLIPDKLRSKKLKIISPRIHNDVYNHLFSLTALKDLILSEQIELTLPSFGPTVNQFRSKITPELDEKINYYDKLSRKEMLNKMAGHDIYLSSSKSDSSPVSLIEAMALGLIPVVGKIDGVAEWMNDKAGFLFELGDPNSLTDIIKKIKNSDKSFDKLLKMNYEKVNRDAVFENNIASHLEQMRQLIGQKI